MIVRTTDTAMMTGLIGSEDEEDAVEEDLDDDIDSVYDVIRGDIKKAKALSCVQQE
jgi:hypothetical protein